MKKNMIFLVIAIIFMSVGIGFAVLPKENLKPSHYKSNTTYAQAIKQDKPIITVFYVDWCSYCLKFMPQIKTLQNTYKNKYNIVTVDCESPEGKILAQQYRIGGFPTVYIIDPEFDNRVHIDNTYYGDMNALKGEFDRYLNLRDRIK